MFCDNRSESSQIIKANSLIEAIKNVAKRGIGSSIVYASLLGCRNASRYHCRIVKKPTDKAYPTNRGHDPNSEKPKFPVHSRPPVAVQSRAALAGGLAQCGHFIPRRFHQVLHIGSRDHETRTEFHQLRNVLDIRADAADAKMLSPSLAGFGR